MMTSRNRQGRGTPVRRELTLALQTIYAQDNGAVGVSGSGIAATELIEWLCVEEPATPAARRNAAALVSGVAGAASRLDAVIQAYAPALPVNLLAIVDRSILRMAIYELTERTQIPRNVVISEAVELATRYGSESSARFVNGVLGSVRNDLPDPPDGNDRPDGDDGIDRNDSSDGNGRGRSDGDGDGDGTDGSAVADGVF